MFFVIAGLGHFFAPENYLRIMPPYFPWPGKLVAITGLAEMLGGIGICLPFVRRVAAFGLIVLLVCVFPANIHALSTGMIIAGHVVPTWMLWMRLPLQPLTIAWVYWSCLRSSR